MTSPKEPEEREPAAPLAAASERTAAPEEGAPAPEERAGGEAPPARGIFGGPLTFEGGRSFEEAPAEVLSLLATEAAPPPAPPGPADLVRFRANVVTMGTSPPNPGRVAYDGDLAGLMPIAEAGLPQAELLAALAQGAALLSALHEDGRVHGDLGPWSIRVGGGRLVLLAPAGRVASGALIAARIRHAGAPLGDAAFCSGGALAARQQSEPADDVYALGGLTHWLLSGELPVGRVDFAGAAAAPLRDLAISIGAALAASPAQRPSMAELAAALKDAARLSAGPAAPERDAEPGGAEPRATEPRGAEAKSTPPGPSRPEAPRQAARPGQASEGRARARAAGPRREEPRAAGPRGGPWTSPPQARPGHSGGDPRPPEGKQLSTVLALLLAVGGLFVLVGALWVVAVGWAILGEGGRFGLLFVLTVGIAGAGFALDARGYARSGMALIVLGTQMLWADGGYLLNLGDALGSVGAWAGVAAFVSAVSAALAVRRRSFAAGVLTAIGLTIFAFCFNVATGRPGQLAFGAAVTLALALAGVLAERRERPGAALTLLACATQMLWLDAGCVLDLLDVASRSGPWALASGLVVAVTLAIAVQRRAPALAWLAALDFVVFATTFSVATGRPGQLGLSLAVTLAAALAGTGLEKKGDSPFGSLLTVAATQLLWVDAALILDLRGSLESSGAWTIASAIILAVTYAVALRRSPGGGGAGVVAAFDAAVFAGCLGAFLSRGEPLGPPLYALAVAAFDAVLSAIAHRADRPDVSVPFTVSAMLAALASVALALALPPDHLVFATVWPLCVLASLAPFTVRDTGAHRTLARAGAALVLATAPPLLAARQWQDPAYVLATAAIGTAVGCAALRLRDPVLRLMAAPIVLIDACLVPSFAFLGKGLDTGGVAALTGPAGPYVLAALGAPLAMLAAAAYSPPGPEGKAGYRGVEIAALAQIFGLTTIASLVLSEDFVYPTVILLLGALCLVVGVARRHVTIVGFASGALLLNLWIQYFEKLRNTAPTAVLVIGFGLGLLVAGVVYERKVRHVLPKLREWS